MTQLASVSANDFELTGPLNESGTIYLCHDIRKEQVACIAKKIFNKQLSELLTEGYSIKSLFYNYNQALFPDRYWEDKNNKCIVILMPKMSKSIRELIQEYKRKGSFIPMSVLQHAVSEFVSIIRKIHGKQKAHNKIKTSNLFINQDEKYIISDFPPYGCQNDDNYLPPEVIEKKQNKKTGPKESEELLAIDIWQLGICFLEMATLKSASDFIVFRDIKAMQSVILLEIKEAIKRRYSKTFLRIIESMLQINPERRLKINEISSLIQQFNAEQNIDITDEQVDPDPDYILEQFQAKLKTSRENIQNYLEKYEMDRLTCKISYACLDSAFEDIGQKLSEKEKAMIQQKLDPQKTGLMDFSDLILEVTTGKIKMAKLSIQDEQLLKELSNDFLNHLQEKQINLLEYFIQFDPSRNRVMDVVEFNLHMADLKVGFKAEDLRLIRKKYDPQSKGVIYYEHFCKDVMLTNDGVAKGIQNLISEIYLTIRGSFNTFKEFFQNYTNKQALALEDLNKFLKDYSLSAESNVLQGFYDKLNLKGNKSEILFENFRKIFEKEIESELKTMIIHMGFMLENNNLTFLQLLKKKEGGRLINIDNLMESLRSIKMQIKRPDFEFMLNYMGADKNTDLDKIEINNILLKLAKQYENKYIDQFSDKGHQLEQVNNDEEDDSQLLSNQFIPRNYETQEDLLKRIYLQQELFINNIIREVESSGNQFEKYFAGVNDRLDKIELNSRLRKINVPLNEYKFEYRDLLSNLEIASNQNQINTSLFIAALAYFAGKPLSKGSSSKRLLDTKSSVDQKQIHNYVHYFAQLNREMKKRKFDFQQFTILDKYNEQMISIFQFQQILNEELNIDIKDKKYLKFLDQIRCEENDDFVSLLKLKQGLDLDNKTDLLMKKISEDIRNGALNSEKIFKKYDVNKNVKLELREFKTLVRELANKFDNMLIIETLFHKLDQNGDFSISLQEFKNKLLVEIDRSSDESFQQSQFNQTKPTSIVVQQAYELQQAASIENINILDDYDEKGTGLISLKVFRSLIIDDLGRDIEEFKSLIAFLKKKESIDLNKLEGLFNELTEANKLIEQLDSIPLKDVERFFYKYDLNENCVLELREFSKLVKEMDPEADAKPIQFLFHLLDSNHDGAIQLREFKQKITTKSSNRFDTRSSKGEKQKVPLNQQIIKKEDFGRIIYFISKSTFLIQALESLDPKKTSQYQYIKYLGILTFDQVLKAFDEANGPIINIEELKLIANDLQAVQAGQVLYQKLVLNARKQKQDQGSSRIEQIRQQLLQDFDYRGFNFLQRMKIYDQQRTGKIQVSILKQELTQVSKLSNEDFEIILSIVPPNSDKLIDYSEVFNLIQLGPDSITKKVSYNVQQPVSEEDAFENVIDAIVSYMEKKVYTSIAFFRRVNKSSNGLISQEEFEKMLDNLIEMHIEDASIRNFVFERFDHNLDSKISFNELQMVLYTRGQFSPEKIDELKQILLNGIHPQDEQGINLLFNSISNSQQTFIFGQFVEYLKKKQNKYTIVDYDYFFRHFDRQMKERIDFPTFQFVMNEAYSQSQIYQPSPQQLITLSQEIQGDYLNSQIINQNELQLPGQQNQSNSSIILNRFDQESEIQNQKKNSIDEKMSLVSNPLLDKSEDSLNQKKKHKIQQPSGGNFESFYYEEMLKQSQEDIFDLFCQYDLTEKPDFIISNIPDMVRVFNYLMIPISHDHSILFFDCYADTNGQFRYCDLYLKLSGPGKLISKALTLTCMKHIEYNVDNIYNLIGKGEEWGIDEFRYINQALGLNLSNNELNVAFNYWDRREAQKISFQQYLARMTEALIQLPGKKKQELSRSQEEVLKEFFDQLGQVVQKQKYHKIYLNYSIGGKLSLEDFESQTKGIFPVKNLQIEAMRNLFLKDGVILIIDLFNALGIGNEIPISVVTAKQQPVQQIQQQSAINQKQAPTYQMRLYLQSIVTDHLKRKQRTVEELAYFIFESEKQTILTSFQLINKLLELNLGLTEEQAFELFLSMDVKKQGFIGLEEFYSVFKPENIQKDASNEIQISQEIEQDIKIMFEETDTNKVGFITDKELKKALVSIGLNPSEQDIEELSDNFSNIQMQQPGKIDFQQFSSIINQYLNQELLIAEDLFNQLKMDLRRFCRPWQRTINLTQIHQVLCNMGIFIKENELTELFAELDLQKSGEVDIDDFVYYIKETKVKKSAVITIKGYRAVPIRELRNIFASLPENYILSFINSLQKKQLHLTSSCLKPQLDKSGLFYKDINFVDAIKFNLKNSIIERINVPNQILFQIKIKKATGVPVPDGKKFSRSRFLHREISVILFDRLQNKFVGNAVTLNAEWSEENEDEWTFGGQSLFFRWGSFSLEHSPSLDMIFELISYCEVKKKLLAFSVCYSEFKVVNLKRESITLDLYGGAPMKPLEIQQEDIRWERTTFLGKFQKAFISTVKSRLEIEISIPGGKYINSLLAMPDICLVPKWGVHLWKGYREYLAFRSQRDGDVNLKSNGKLTTLMNVIDCPESHKTMAQFWNMHIEKRCRNHSFLLQAIEVIGELCLLMFRNPEFQFQFGDPSAKNYHDKGLIQRRDSIVEETILDIKQSLQIVSQKEQNKKVPNPHNIEPLNVEEMIELPDHEEVLNFEHFLQYKQL